jgi:hypothetical protein
MNRYNYYKKKFFTKSMYPNMLTMKKITTNISTNDLDTLFVLLTVSACAAGGYILYAYYTRPKVNQEDTPLNEPVPADSDVSSEVSSEGGTEVSYGGETDVSDGSSFDTLVNVVSAHPANPLEYGD